MTKITYIPGEIANAAIDEHGNRKPVTRTHHIFDDAKNKNQAQINADVDSTFDFQQSEINALNSQNYVTVDTFEELPATGTVDTIYRVANYDGTQVATNKYAEYAWNGTQYRLMAVRDHGIDEEPTANSDNLVKSGGVLNYINSHTFYACSAELILDKDKNFMKADGTYDTSNQYSTRKLYNFTTDQRIDLVVYTGGNVPMALLFDANNNILATYPNQTTDKEYKHIISDLSAYPNASYMIINAYQYSTHNPIDITLVKGTTLKENYPEKIDNVPTSQSQNLVRSGGVYGALLEMEQNIDDYIDIVYTNKKDKCYVNNQNEETANNQSELYYFNVGKSSEMKIYTATFVAGYCLFIDANNNIVGTPFKPTASYISEWLNVSVPEGAVMLKVSHYSGTGHPDVYPIRVLANHQNYESALKLPFRKTVVNVGMSIWWMDDTAYRAENTIDGEGTVCKGYQSWMGEYFNFPEVVKYAYSGASLGVGNKASSSIMYNYSSEWTAQENAIWTLDTITNDFGRDVPLGVPSDFDNATGINTYYGALRAFKDKVATLSPEAIVVVANALYRGGSTTNALNLTLEDYEEALCYAAAKSGWFFVDQFRTSINTHNYHVALYDGLHPTNFGFRLAVKPWIEQFDIIQKTILK